MKGTPVTWRHPRPSTPGSAETTPSKAKPNGAVETESAVTFASARDLATFGIRPDWFFQWRWLSAGSGGRSVSHRCTRMASIGVCFGRRDGRDAVMCFVETQAIRRSPCGVHDPLLSPLWARLAFRRREMYAEKRNRLQSHEVQWEFLRKFWTGVDE